MGHTLFTAEMREMIAALSPGAAVCLSLLARAMAIADSSEVCSEADAEDALRTCLAVAVMRREAAAGLR